MIFLDSSNLEEIKKYNDYGIIRGVTTNPTIMVKDGVKTLEEIKERTISIANEVYPYPVSVEVLSNEFGEMISQAEDFCDWKDNINVKIPFHGPNGELDTLKVVRILSEEGIEVNCTAMMSAQQCISATLSGARYVSLFGGRVNNMGYECMHQIKAIRNILDRFNLDVDTELIIGSVREPINIIEWLEAGADIVTVPPSILNKSLVHSRTKETVQMFLDDAKKLKEKLK